MGSFPEFSLSLAAAIVTHLVSLGLLPLRTDLGVDQNAFFLPSLSPPDTEIFSWSKDLLGSLMRFFF